MTGCEFVFSVSHSGGAFLLKPLGWVVLVVHSLGSDYWVLWLVLGTGGWALWFTGVQFWIWGHGKTLEKKDRVENCSRHHVEPLTLVDQRNKREARQNGNAMLWS